MRAAIGKLLGVALLLSLPFLTGTIAPSWFFPLFVASLAIAGIALARRTPLAVNAALVLVAIAISLAGVDLAARVLGLGPTVLLQRWPAMPLVNRFVPGLDRDICYHDLAAMSGRAASDACTRVVTDASGFRNDPAATKGPLDVILLGDSFGSGAAPQDETIRGFLARDHALRAHDLSTPSSSPWQEYVNFESEQARLATRRGTVIAWLLIAGNDLDDEYGPIELERLPWKSVPEQWLHRLRVWRGRSPLRHALERNAPSRDVEAHALPDGRPLLFYTPYFDRVARDASALRRHPNLPALRATVARLAQRARAREMRTVIFVVPMKEEVYAWVREGGKPWTSDPAPSGFYDVVREICAEERLACVDLKATMIAESRKAFEESGRLLFWHDDTHPNAAGNRFIAARIRAALASP